jgi:hypothetical protein
MGLRSTLLFFDCAIYFYNAYVQRSFTFQTRRIVCQATHVTPPLRSPRNALQRRTHHSARFIRYVLPELDEPGGDSLNHRTRIIEDVLDDLGQYYVGREDWLAGFAAKNENCGATSRPLLKERTDATSASYMTEASSAEGLLTLNPAPSQPRVFCGVVFG